MAKRRRASAATPAVRGTEEAGVVVSTPSYDHDPRSESYALEADVVRTALRDRFDFRLALRCSTPQASDSH
jgi:hypothetical protein